MMEHPDPVYGYIDQEIEKAKNDILFGEDRIRMHDALNYLFRLAIEHRMRLIYMKIHDRLQAVQFSTADSTQKLHARNLGQRVTSHASWFMGAIQEASDPTTVYEQWLQKLKAEHGLEQFGARLEESDVLPPPPPALQE